MAWTPRRRPQLILRLLPPLADDDDHAAFDGLETEHDAAIRSYGSVWNASKIKRVKIAGGETMVSWRARRAGPKSSYGAGCIASNATPIKGLTIAGGETTDAGARFAATYEGGEATYEGADDQGKKVTLSLFLVVEIETIQS